jgi:hypothetical protein
LPCSCEGLASEANLKIAERGEDKADARQGTRLKAARHFPHIHKHCIRHTRHAIQPVFSRINFDKCPKLHYGILIPYTAEPLPDIVTRFKPLPSR